jgi:UDP-N-acetyl-D-galactosamine dehydrogenase
MGRMSSTPPAIHPPEVVAVIGLGYVGLPLAAALARVHTRVIGFDISAARIAALNAVATTSDATSIADAPPDLVELIVSGRLVATTDPAAIAGASAFIIAVPTPITDARRPDLGPLLAATDTVAAALAPGALVVVESTVAPGTTLDVVTPRLAAISGLAAHVDFMVAFSPERINPGDPAHAVEKVPKVVAGADAAALARVSDLYRRALPSGIVAAPSIAAAELAKLVENTQRDLNIALMNELAIICDRLNLRTADVIAVARTKWNFLPFEPGLVGGHCISVDPWYLTDCAERLGLHPEVITAGRRTNDSLAAFVAQKTMKLLTAVAPPRRPRVGVFGVTFKENFPDIRNSQALVLCHELQSFGVTSLVIDPVADPAEVAAYAGVTLADPADAIDLDALIVAVRHRAFLADLPGLCARLRPGGVLVDVKSAFEPAAIPPSLRYWSL